MKQDNTTEVENTFNRGDNDANFTPLEQRPNTLLRDNKIIENTHITEIEEEKPVYQVTTAEKIKFTRLVASGITPTTAYRQAFPKSKNQAYGTVRNKAYQLMTEDGILTEIETVKENKARLVRLAEDRLEEVLLEGDIHSRGSRVSDVAMFMYDHANGKATQRLEVQSRKVSINIDLTGHVLDEQASAHRKQL